MSKYGYIHVQHISGYVVSKPLEKCIQADLDSPKILQAVAEIIQHYVNTGFHFDSNKISPMGKASNHTIKQFWPPWAITCISYESGSVYKEMLNSQEMDKSLN